MWRDEAGRWWAKPLDLLIIRFFGLLNVAPLGISDNELQLAPTTPGTRESGRRWPPSPSSVQTRQCTYTVTGGHGLGHSAG